MNFGKVSIGVASIAAGAAAWSMTGELIEDHNSKFYKKTTVKSKLQKMGLQTGSFCTTFVMTATVLFSGANEIKDIVEKDMA